MHTHMSKVSLRPSQRSQRYPRRTRGSFVDRIPRARRQDMFLLGLIAWLESEPPQHSTEAENTYNLNHTKRNPILGALARAIQELAQSQHQHQPKKAASKGRRTRTSAFARISHPVSSDNDLIRNSGVFPIQPSMPSTTAGGPGLATSCGCSSPVSGDADDDGVLERCFLRSSASRSAFAPIVARIPATKAVPM